MTVSDYQTHQILESVGVEKLRQATFEGELIGSIEDQAGTGGFGYDPIVWLPQYKKTVAEISADEKNRISHRGKAVREIAQILKTLDF